jgi:hypothetical protein
MRRRITRGRLTVGFAVIVVAVSAVLPFLVSGGLYGEAPTPGSATVRLPAGQVDATLRTAGPGDEPMPPLSIHISGPDGTAPPDVIESPLQTQLGPVRHAGAGMGGARRAGGRLPR